MQSAGGRSVAVATVVVTAVLLLVVAALVVVAAVRGQPAPAGDTARGEQLPVVRVGGSRAVRAAAVLRAWDARRAAAWAAGDPAALRRLYVAGSRAGARDVAMLRRWRARGLRVTRMTMQVHQIRVRVRTDRRLVLLVTDRLASAVAVRVDGSGEWRLPSDRASTRRLELRRVAGRWRLAAAYDRPLARTAATSGSANS